MLSFGKRTIFVRCQCSVMTTALWSVCRNVYARIVAKLRCAGFGRYYSGFGRCAGIVPAARFASSGFRKACSVNGIGSNIGSWMLEARAQTEEVCHLAVSRFDSCPDYDG